MARYIHGWIECKNHYASTDKPEWVAVIDIRYLLYNVKDYNGFNCLFGEDEPLDLLPLAPIRGLPEDVSAQVKADHTRYDPGPDYPSEHRPAYDFSTSTSAEYIYWKEITQAGWAEPGQQNRNTQSVYQTTPQGKKVLCVWVYRVSRPPTSWISWSELKQVDWEKKADKSGATRREIIANWENVLSVLETLSRIRSDKELRLISWLS